MKIKVFYDDPSAKMFFIKAKPGWCYARVNWKGEIFFSKSRMDVIAMYRGLARHEFEHIYQMRRHTRIGYHLFYGVDFAYRLLKHWNLETAYRNVWYERQAVAAERHPLTFVEEMILLKGVED